MRPGPRNYHVDNIIINEETLPFKTEHFELRTFKVQAGHFKYI